MEERQSVVLSLKTSYISYTRSITVWHFFDSYCKDTGWRWSFQSNVNYWYVIQ